MEEAERVFDEVEKIIGLPHPWKGRATIQRSRCYITISEQKENNLEENEQEEDEQEVSKLATAEKILNEAEDYIKRVADVEQKNFLTGDLVLTRVWIHERRAKGTDGDKHWERSLEEVKNLLQGQHLPTRLRIEKELHQGRALLHLGQGKNALQ